MVLEANGTGESSGVEVSLCDKSSASIVFEAIRAWPVSVDKGGNS